jgi:ATP adenylyltransferase
VGWPLRFQGTEAIAVDLERIWAPWRLAYISGEDRSPVETSPDLPPGADADCFLCRAVAEREASLVIDRGPKTLTVLNRYPYNNGHLLVAPLRHLSRLDELSADEHHELAATLTTMVGALEKALHPQGFNIGLNLGQVSGAGLPGHLHWHIVPRWNGDTNFMPVVASVKVIPQSLEALGELLRHQLENCPNKPK